MTNKTPLYFIPLGGCGEIGMNAAFYGDGQEWIMVDCGITFSRKPDGVLLPDIRSFLSHIKKLWGLILTHAHEDHYGAVVHLWHLLKCPIYATPFTMKLLSHKLKEANIKVPELYEQPLGSKFSIGPFNAEFVTLTHSIPEPNAVVLRKDEHTIFHTGDWKIDPDPLIGKTTDEETLINLGKEGVTAIVCDSTNVFEDGTSGSEKIVQIRLKETVSECTEGLVVIACFASNVARILSCYLAGKENGRFVVLTGRSLIRMEEAARHCGYFGKDVTFLSPEEAKGVDRSKLLVITTGSQAEPRAALSAMGRGTHPFIKLRENDTIIFSSRVIPGNEESIFALQNQLIRKGMRIINYKDCGEIHVSGHPHREELRQMYAWLRPNISVPVHGEDRHIYEHARLAIEEFGVPQAIRPHNGQMYMLAPGPAELVQTLSYGRMFVDGKRLIEANGRIMRERNHLLDAGIIFITLVISRELRKIIDRHIEFHGFCKDEKDKMAMSDVVMGSVRDALPKKITLTDGKISLTEIGAIEGTIIQRVRDVMKEKFSLRPVVKAHIVWGKMAVLTVLTEPDIRLRKKSLPIQRVNAETCRILDNLYETMIAYGGCGISAPQVNIHQRIFLMKTEKEGPLMECINPEIFWTCTEEVLWQEGCLSLPSYYAEVKRPKEVRVRFLDRHGVRQERHLSALEAVCAQHEIDHLNGVLFIDYLSHLKKYWQYNR